MSRWLHTFIVPILFGSFTILILVILLIRRRFFSDPITVTHLKTINSLSQTELVIKQRPSYQLFGRASNPKSYFNWADHPSLITDAVENGWSRFAFTTYTPYPSVKSSLFGSLRVTGENYTQNTETNDCTDVEESWEIGEESVDFMQKLQFKIKNRAVTKTIRMGLPLPGPALTNSFPEEAYFEIMVVDLSEEIGKKLSNGEGEKTKLLFEQSNSKESSFNVSSSRGSQLLEELKISSVSRRGGGGGGDSDGSSGVTVTIGLTVGGYVTTRIPGTYSGSIGFNSDGSVFLGGMKLVFESEKESWGKSGKVIGCGFDPKKKKVYFTVDSKLLHVIHCKSEDFGMPLYPIFATNTDMTVLINLGQSSFKYSPSNAHRTPNPCFVGPVVDLTPAALGYEDSKELFSMGRINAEWLTVSHTPTISTAISNRSSKVLESEDELFEIVLDTIYK